MVCCVVWCGVPEALLPEGNGRDVYPRVQVNGRAVCLSVRCVLVCCCTVMSCVVRCGAVWCRIVSCRVVLCCVASRRMVTPNMFCVLNSSITQLKIFFGCVVLLISYYS